MGHAPPAPSPGLVLAASQLLPTLTLARYSRSRALSPDVLQALRREPGPSRVRLTARVEGNGTMRTVAVTALLSFGLMACSLNTGGDEATTTSPPTEATALPSSTETSQPETVATCSEDLTSVVATLADLESRTHVKLAFQEYSEKVADAKVAYDKVRWGSEPQECVQQVGVPAEAALNDYVAAFTLWNRQHTTDDTKRYVCFGNFGCDSIQGKLQRKWHSAAREVAKAQRALE